MSECGNRSLSKVEIWNRKNCALTNISWSMSWSFSFHVLIADKVSQISPRILLPLMRPNHICHSSFTNCRCRAHRSILPTLCIFIPLFLLHRTYHFLFPPKCLTKRSTTCFRVALHACMNVRVEQPDDLLCFRGWGATRYELEGVERRGRRVGIEVLTKGEGGYWSVVTAEEVLE